MIEAGLRVDVDTFRGTREGVPRLLRILARHGVCATFFFSVGPDNMGRHVWRLLRPRFFRKMWRSDAPSLYGWDILLAGTAWPGKPIGQRLAPTIRDTDGDGHEIGLHAWDHHGWQAHVAGWQGARIESEIAQGTELLGDILGRPVTCSATAGWRTTQAVVDAKEKFGFCYNSDCRGTHLFRPELSHGGLGVPQIPVDLPTYDEVVGSAVDAAGYNDYILERFHPERLNVYTIHAEVEGGVMAEEFDRFMSRAKAQGVRFKPLGELLPDSLTTLPSGRIGPGWIAGREGWLGVQAECI